MVVSVRGVWEEELKERLGFEPFKESPHTDTDIDEGGEKGLPLSFFQIRHC